MITDELEYKSLRREIQEKYEAARKELEEKEKDDLEALEKVWALIQEKQVKDNAEREDSGYGALTATVKYAIQKIDLRRFTKSDILSEMGRLTPRVAENCSSSSLSGALKRLERKGFVRCVKQGKGSSPNIYRKNEDNR